VRLFVDISVSVVLLFGLRRFMLKRVAEGPPPGGRIAVTSDAMPGVVRYVDSYATLAREISLSRIYAGAHFRSSTEVGAELGRRVAEFAMQGYLKPVH
jgi:hypothetical protein